MKLEFHHSVVLGQTIVTVLKDFAVEPENQMIADILPGAITFLVRDLGGRKDD